MKFYTLEDVANQLHISTGTARNRISRGDSMPPYLKVGRRLLFSETEFSTWLTNIAKKDGSVSTVISVDREKLFEIDSLNKKAS